MGTKNYEISGKEVVATYGVIATSPSMYHPEQFDSIGDAAIWAETTTDKIRKAIDEGTEIKRGNISWYFDEL